MEIVEMGCNFGCFFLVIKPLDSQRKEHWFLRFIVTVRAPRFTREEDESRTQWVTKLLPSTGRARLEHSALIVSFSLFSFFVGYPMLIYLLLLRGYFNYCLKWGLSIMIFFYHIYHLNEFYFFIIHLFFRV